MSIEVLLCGPTLPSLRGAAVQEECHPGHRQVDYATRLW